MYRSTKVIDGEIYVLKIDQDEYAESPREWDNIGTMVCFHSRYDLGDKHNYSEVEDWLEDMLRDVLTEQQIEYVFVENCGDENNIEIRQEGDELWYVFNKDGDKIVYTGGYDTKEEAETDFLQFKDDFLEHEVFEMLSENIGESLELLSEKYVILPLYLYDHSGLTMNTSGFSCGWDSGQVGFIYASKEKFRKETGYTEKELFDKNSKRVPSVLEHVKVKGHEGKGFYGFGQVESIQDGFVTVNFDYNKGLSYRDQKNIVTVPIGDIVEVMANRAEELLEGEVETFDMYLTGQVYSFSIEKEVKCKCCNNITYEHVDSCGGFYGADFPEMKHHVWEELHDMFDKVERYY